MINDNWAAGWKIRFRPTTAQPRRPAEGPGRNRRSLPLHRWMSRLFKLCTDLHRWMSRCSRMLCKRWGLLTERSRRIHHLMDSISVVCMMMLGRCLYRALQGQWRVVDLLVLGLMLGYRGKTRKGLLTLHWGIQFPKIGQRKRCLLARRPGA